MWERWVRTWPLAVWASGTACHQRWIFSWEEIESRSIANPGFWKPGPPDLWRRRGCMHLGPVARNAGTLPWSALRAQGVLGCHRCPSRSSRCHGAAVSTCSGLPASSARARKGQLDTLSRGRQTKPVDYARYISLAGKKIGALIGFYLVHPLETLISYR